MTISKEVKQKIRDLPDKPGCYLMRNRYGKIIYIGKASSLRKRVQSYFRLATRRSAGPKLQGLVKSIHDFDIVVRNNEADALLTESNLIKKYRPHYNIVFRDDKRYLLLRVDLSQDLPRFSLCRIRRKDNALYFGPYTSSFAARAILEFIERYFGLRKCTVAHPGTEDYKHCLDGITSYCSAPCIGKISEAGYRKRVRQACSFLNGGMPEAFKEIEKAIQDASAKLDFEKAAALRDSLYYIRKAIKEKAHHGRIAGLSTERAKAGIKELADYFKLSKAPHTIDAYDVSAISGTHAVASVVVARDGVPTPSLYRRFRIKTVHAIDDPRMMAEAVRRRISRLKREKRNLPDFILVDGGITQLRAAKLVLKKIRASDIPTAGLAKKYEEVWWPGRGKVRVIKFSSGSSALSVLQGIRDEAHRFALAYHQRLREKRIRESALDDVPGIGKRKKVILLKHFGSLAKIREATITDLAQAPGIGYSLAAVIKRELARR